MTACDQESCTHYHHYYLYTSIPSTFWSKLCKQRWT